jgi:hypothetical protein
MPDLLFPRNSMVCGTRYIRGRLLDKASQMGNRKWQSWTGLLAQIRKRPGMYLGSANLQALHMFLQGFKMAEDIYAVPELQRQEVNDFSWHDFETYVADLHNTGRLSLSSFGLAQYEAQGKSINTFDTFMEHPGAWDIWWQWYDEFTGTPSNEAPFQTIDPPGGS